MANVKISELAEKIVTNDTDIMIVEDSDTKKITVGNLMKSMSFGLKPRLYYLDAYNDFFGGMANDFVTGQATTSTTTTAEVASGGTVLPLTSVSGISTGVVLVIKAGTADQQILSVQSVVGNDVTISPALTATLVSGSAVSPLWVNSSHLIGNGIKAWTYWFINKKDTGGNYIIPRTGSPKITVLGDSWVSQNVSTITTVISENIPTAVITVSGVTGNTSTDLLNRFDTDVPSDSQYVIFNEPGVNDVSGVLTYATMMSNLIALVVKIRAIGAVPIFTGLVPLSDYIGEAKNYSNQLIDVIGTGEHFPSSPLGSLLIHTPESNSIGIGEGALINVTTGTGNIAIGTSAGLGCLSASNNIAIGKEALKSCIDNSNVAIGHIAGSLLTSGQDNVLVGKGAGHYSNSSTTLATTTGDFQTVVGSEALGSGTTGYVVAIGYRASASAAYSTAIGSGATASHNGSVVIGKDSGGVSAASAAANDFVLGTANHNVKIAGRINIAQRTPTGTADTQGNVGDITSDANYIYVKTSAGWKRSALATW